MAASSPRFQDSDAQLFATSLPEIVTPILRTTDYTVLSTKGYTF